MNDPIDREDLELVTVVVPARNEEANIEACLASILRQTHRLLEVVVVDGASVDATTERVEAMRRRDPRIRLLHNPASLIPISLNLALAEARGRWLVRVDAHAVIPPDYVANVVAHLRTGRWGGVGGRKDGVARTDAGSAVALAMASRFGVGNSAYHYADEPQTVDHIPFGAYPVDLARRLGGWDERLAVNQDFEFDHRVRQAGHELLLDPALSIQWECRQSLGALFAQYRRYGRGKVKVARLHPDSIRVRHLAAPVITAVGAVSAVLAVTGRPRAAGVLMAPYALALASASTVTARRAARVGVAARIPGAFVAMHAGWGVGFWQGLSEVAGRSTRVWAPTPRDRSDQEAAPVQAAS